jgi:hypothetical protein
MVYSFDLDTRLSADFSFENKRLPAGALATRDLCEFASLATAKFSCLAFATGRRRSLCSICLILLLINFILSNWLLSLKVRF